MQRQSLLQKQHVSPYHLTTAKFIADTTQYMRLKYPLTCLPNDATTFDITDETHRFRTFNSNWNPTSFDTQDLANEGFFSLATTSHNIQCFSCGIILTKFPPHVSSFAIHLLASPECHHLRLQDPTNKSITHTASIDDNSQQNEDITNIANTDPEQLIKETGLTKITTLVGKYYKCSSCHGTHARWTQGEHPWKTHARHFPYCSNIISQKNKFFVKHILNKTSSMTFQMTTYYCFIKQQIRIFETTTLNSELTSLINHGSALQLLHNLNTQQDIVSKLTQYYSVEVESTIQTIDEQTIKSLQKVIDCIICMKNQRNTLLMPCRHFIACTECINKCEKKCPVCRQHINHTIVVFSS